MTIQIRDRILLDGEEYAIPDIALEDSERLNGTPCEDRAAHVNVTLGFYGAFSEPSGPITLIDMGIGTVPAAQLEAMVREVFPLTPKGITDALDRR